MGYRGRSAEDKETLRERYFLLGTHYYAAARFAYFGTLMPMAGNLFHHAVEMYLKGYLCRWLNESERRKLRHSLTRIWKRFKRYAGNPTLSKYDTMIKELDRFETLRYPERWPEQGVMLVQWDLTRSVPTFSTSTHSQVSSYYLVVHDIDELVAYVFLAVPLNPRFISNEIHPAEAVYLKKDNPSGLW
ncbi:MAG: hypothetical protein ACREQA_04845 [Candidatus Binatia bacterium]